MIFRTRCDRGVHDFRVAYDEVENGANVEIEKATMEALRAGLYRRVVRAIYCKRCGKQLTLSHAPEAT